MKIQILFATIAYLGMTHAAANVHLAPGLGFVLAVDGKQRLWAWGDSTDGKLGLGNAPVALIPQRVGTGLWRSVKSSERFASALALDSTLWAWGSNDQGQLGDGTKNSTKNPVQIGMAKWSQIALGQRHQLGIASDSSLWSWGFNEFGQLGTGDFAPKTQPFRVSIAKWLQISANSSHSLAIQKDSSLWAWGNNSSGQLGLGDTVYRTQIVKVGSAKWKSISCAAMNAYGIQADSSLWVWGDGMDGQLGLGALTRQWTPAKLGSSKWLMVKAQGNSVYALREDSTLWAWGDNSFGQLALTSIEKSNTPLQISGKWIQVEAGWGFVLAQKADSSLWSWGRGQEGQLGMGSLKAESDPQGFGFVPQTVNCQKLSDIVYGESPRESNCTSTSPGSFLIFINSPMECSGLGNQVKTLAAGTCLWNVQQKGTAEYAPSALWKDTFEISKRTLWLKADKGQKIYGSADPVLTWKASGYGFGDDSSSLSGGLLRDTGSQVAKYLIRIGTLGHPGYAVQFTTDTFSIQAKELTLKALAKQKIYGDPDPKWTWQISGLLQGEDSTVLVGEASRSLGENVGAYVLNPGNLQAANYQILWVADTLKILPKSLTLTVYDTNKIYGDEDPLYRWSASGFVNGDDENSLSGVLTRNSGDTVGYYPIQQGSLNASNYSLQFKGANLQIKMRPLQIQAEAQIKFVGDADPVLTFRAEGLAKVSDTLGISGRLMRSVGESAGKYPIQLGTLQVKNYLIQYTADSLEILRKDQIISWVDPDLSQTQGDSLEMSALASSGLDVSIQSESPDICVVRAQVLVVVGSGICKMKANQSGNTEFNPAPEVKKEISVAKINQVFNPKWLREGNWEGWTEILDLRGARLWAGEGFQPKRDWNRLLKTQTHVVVRNTAKGGTFLVRLDTLKHE